MSIKEGLHINTLGDKGTKNKRILIKIKRMNQQNHKQSPFNIKNFNRGGMLKKI